ncbi:trehalase-like [Sitophilus oryzae]|uniref:Trehalase n=1 Tax=Sitophilus oryzae TaxID=7048 RepID=A0A6J2Y5A0_SITOR|nr:trehalase-like [Sitophilus oryzae]
MAWYPRGIKRTRESPNLTWNHDIRKLAGITWVHIPNNRQQLGPTTKKKNYLCPGELHHSRDLLTTHCFVVVLLTTFASSESMNSIDESRLLWFDECYTDLKSGAESGWDFTSRWIFDSSGEPNNDLTQIETRRNIPVDLNAFLYKSFKQMHYFNVVLRQQADAKYWLDKAEEWRYNMEKVLYDPEDGIWYDYDLKLNKPRKYFAASNFAPLWADAIDDDVKKERGNNAVRYLKKFGILDYHGVPSTLFSSGLQWDFPNAWSPYQNMIIFGLERSGDEEAQEVAKMLALKWVQSNIKAFNENKVMFDSCSRLQWDFPNAWSPYQNMIIFGLERSGDEEAQEVARMLALKWVQSNIKAFNENKVMFEKYNSMTSGQFGGGGEYHIQSGFGWTNGCIMEIVDHFFRVKKRRHVDMQD